MKEITKKTASLKSQSAWLMFAKVTGFALSSLLPFLVVRSLTQDLVGLYRQTFQVIVNAAGILPLGFSMSAFYFLNRQAERRRAAVLNILIFNFVIGGLACLGLYLYPQFLGNIFQSDEMTRLAPMIGVVIWLWIFSAFLEIVALANQEAKMATVFIILAQFTKTVLMASAVIFFATVEAFIVAAIIQAVLQSCVLLWYLNRKFSGFWREFDWKFFREQAFYALPFGLAGLLYTLQTDIHNYFVGYRFSAAEYAIYAYGCFQLPLVAMLAESTTAVLIPRMSELQAQGNKREMIVLTTRTMQKLSFFYFPAYAFLLVTANVFVITLFTKDFAASTPIFIINLTLLPFDIWVVDPIVRAYKEFGRLLLVLRVLILIGMVAALSFGIQHFDLRGMIAIVLVISLLERFISSYLIARKLKVTSADWKLLGGVWKTALVSAVAGIVTLLVYRQITAPSYAWVAEIAEQIFAAPKQNLIDFFSGTLILGISMLIFAPVYLLGMNYLGMIDDGEKQIFKNLLKKLRVRKKETPNDLSKISALRESRLTPQD